MGTDLTQLLHKCYVENTKYWHAVMPEHWDWYTDGRHATIHELRYGLTKLHYHNYQVWHAEDYCRSKQPELIVRYKPIIDKHNQLRCNTVEAIDLYFMQQLVDNATAPINSETIGSLLDRISVTDLKIYHMRELGPAYANKLCILEKQRVILHTCALELLQEIHNGVRRCYPFFQLKMYNSADTNPKMA